MNVADGKKILAAYGPFTISAVCDSRYTGYSHVHIDVTSSVDGWINSVVSSDTLHSKGEVISLQDDAGTSSIYGREDGSASVTGPDGSRIVLSDKEYGLNVFGHDCLTAGTLTLFTSSSSPITLAKKKAR